LKNSRVFYDAPFRGVV